LTFPTSMLTSKASISSAGEGAQQVNRGTNGVGVAVEPAIEVAGVQDDGHAVVDRGHQLVRLDGDDGVTLQPLAVRGVLPCVPKAAKSLVQNGTRLQRSDASSRSPV
jgi:hypothetical protein